EALDVISVSPVPDGPFGQDLRYGRVLGRVNGFVHELTPSAHASFHQFCTDVDDSWTTVPNRGRWPGSGSGAVERDLPTRPSRTSRSAAAATMSPRSAARNTGRRGRATRRPPHRAARPRRPPRRPRTPDPGGSPAGRGRRR